MSLDLPELGAVLDAADGPLRLETLGRYASASDVDWVARYLDGSDPPDRQAKRGWLDRLSRAAERGHPRRRLRVIHAPATNYERYSCEWGYVDNVAAGEDVRVLDAVTSPELVRAAEHIGEVNVIGDRVIDLVYDDDARFVVAQDLPAVEAREIARRVEDLWAHAEAFDPWWTTRRDLHRDAHT